MRATKPAHRRFSKSDLTNRGSRPLQRREPSQAGAPTRLDAGVSGIGPFRAIAGRSASKRRTNEPLGCRASLLGNFRTREHPGDFLAPIIRLNLGHPGRHPLAAVENGLGD